MNKLPKLINTLGVIIIVSSIIRWFFIFYDPSQMILGFSIGTIVIGFAYIYDWIKQTEKDINKLNKRLDSFTEWWTRQEVK